jgi:hypothetical protein
MYVFLPPCSQYLIVMQSGNYYMYSLRKKILGFRENFFISRQFSILARNFLFFAKVFEKITFIGLRAHLCRLHNTS